MVTEDLAMRIATFRFGIISDFVSGPRLPYGDKQRLLKEKTERVYDIPGSSKTRVSASTIHSWIGAYKKAGFRIEGLKPRERNDKGSYRKLDTTIRMAIKELVEENAHYTVPVMINKLRHMKIIGVEDVLNKASIYRFLKKEKPNIIQALTPQVDRRKFEASYPNEIWQCDVMHGPMVKMPEGPQKKAYLIAIIDDYSRLMVHAQFYLNETLESLKEALKQAVMKRGLPTKFYVDNGACYRAINLEQILASLGIGLIHSRPYKPQGRGKIERWFGYVRQDFLPTEADRPLLLTELNERFESWVDRYNATPHSAIKMAPYDRFRKDLACIRPAPADLLSYFRGIELRRVRKDRTVQLSNQLFEVPVGLIDKQVELKFHSDKPNDVEIFFEGRSYGMAVILNPQINAKIGREGSISGETHKNELPKISLPTQIPTGKLFGLSEGEIL